MPQIHLTSGGRRKNPQKKNTAAYVMLASTLICFSFFALYVGPEQNSAKPSDLAKAEEAAAGIISKNEALSAVFGLKEEAIYVFGDNNDPPQYEDREWNIWNYLEELMKTLLLY